MQAIEHAGDECLKFHIEGMPMEKLDNQSEPLDWRDSSEVVTRLRKARPIAWVEAGSINMSELNFRRYADDETLLQWDDKKEDFFAAEVERQRCFRECTPLAIGDGKTTFTRWARFETWTKEEAAYLICGFIPPSILIDIQLITEVMRFFMAFAGMNFPIPLTFCPLRFWIYGKDARMSLSAIRPNPF